MRRLIGLLGVLTVGALVIAGCGDWGKQPAVALPNQATDDVVPIPLDPERPRPAPPGQAETLRVPRPQ